MEQYTGLPNVCEKFLPGFQISVVASFFSIKSKKLSYIV